MRFRGTVTKVSSSRGKKTLTVALAPDASMDELDAYSELDCTFEIGCEVQDEDFEVDAFTGEVVG